MNILNLTQHQATPEQEVLELESGWDLARLREYLTFKKLPARDDIVARASGIAELAVIYFKERGVAGIDRAAMIGGAPYLMSALESALRERGITPLYSFSRRTSREVVKDDGRVEKINVFKHSGWVQAGGWPLQPALKGRSSEKR